MESKYLLNGIFYYFVWGDDAMRELVQLIEHGTKITHVVIMGPEEYEAPEFFINREQYKFFKGYLNYNNIKLIHVTSAITDPEINYRYYANDQQDTICWEMFFAHQVVTGQLERDIIPYGHEEKIHKHFTSMNGRSHKWRCMFMDYMAKYNLIDKGYVSWHNVENWDYDYKFKYWTPKKMSFDRRWRKSADGLLDILFPPEEFKTSLFSVISESNVDCLFVTEKTFIPIFHKRPFIVYGPPNFQKYLKSKGYQLFDEIIDYSFDEIDDNEVRADMMMQQVEKICNHDIYELKSRLQPKVEHNFRNMMNDVVSRKHIHPHIIKLIDINHDLTSHYSYLLNIGRSEYFEHYLDRNKIEIKKDI